MTGLAAQRMRSGHAYQARRVDGASRRAVDLNPWRAAARVSPLICATRHPHHRPQETRQLAGGHRAGCNMGVSMRNLRHGPENHSQKAARKAGEVLVPNRPRCPAKMDHPSTGQSHQRLDKDLSSKASDYCKMSGVVYRAAKRSLKKIGQYD